ncbi:MAG: DUF3866 family protein [Rubrobacter sp.]|nr:DUF3866 family protein [Rubrobacter sp.]
MSAIRRAEVLSVDGEGGRASLRILDGPLAGEACPGVFYPEFGGAPEAGDAVLANTVGVEMRLGTGGAAFILPGAGGGAPENRNHFVKLPYTPLQFPATPGEIAESLVGVPVAVLPLHSHLAVACAAAGKLRPGCRVAFVWNGGGALPVAFSRSVAELKEKGLLHLVVSSGNCIGGDVEAVNEYSGLLSAAGAGLILAGIGPGVVGTGSPYGHGGMSASSSLNAAASLGAEPILAPRISFADGRERHRGISHHTRSILEAALARCRVAFPEGASGSIPLEGLPERHEYIPVGFGAAGLEEASGLTFESMGRTYTDDEHFFDSAAAAVWLALGGEAGDESEGSTGGSG